MCCSLVFMLVVFDIFLLNLVSLHGERAGGTWNAIAVSWPVLSTGEKHSRRVPIVIRADG